MLTTLALMLAWSGMLAAPAKGAPSGNPLTLFKNYFVTGDMASTGATFRGTGNSTTNLSTAIDLHLQWCNDGDRLRKQCVPKYVDNAGNARNAPTTGGVANAPTDLIGAFVYWEVLEKTAKPSGARGIAQATGAGLAPPNPNAHTVKSSPTLSYPVAFDGKPVADGSNAAPCWSTGGSTGASNGAPNLRVYRVDFLRYLEVDSETGSRIPWARIQLPDSGSSGNTVPITEGASLVVLYRNYNLPFRGVVLYDGAFTMNQATQGLDQTLVGFYESAEAPNLADPSQHTKLAHIVGDGQSNFPESLTLGTGSYQTTVPNPFNGPYWDDITFDISANLPPGSSSFNTSVTHGTGSFDCLSWGAIWLSTPVQDSDQDGLLDVWESSKGFTEVVSGKPINLTWKAGNETRGADPCVRNIFIEVDWMSLGQTVGNVQAHNHSFRQDSLDLVGQAFANAGGSLPATTTPVAPNCPGGIGAGIKAYFDVGNNYQTDPYVMPANLAEGGDSFNELAAPTYCTYASTHPETCVFPNQPGVTSWKTAVHHIQKMHANATKQYFSDYRSQIFHWAFMTHALAMKGALLPKMGGFPDQYQANSTSGRADLPGGDFVVALGLWRFTNPGDQYRGSKILQASTFLHELAHNLWGFHGGEELKRDKFTKRVVQGINCKPQQQSVLNYMYHAAGVLDRNGIATVDLSGQAIAAANSAEVEANLDEVLGIGTSATDTTETKYRLRWYAPVSAVEKVLGIPAGTITPARAHCDGTVIGPNETSMIRADRLAQPADALRKINVDWNYNGIVSPTPLGSSPSYDINFDGYTDETSSNFAGVNDWSHIIAFHGLQQVSTRRSVFGLSVGVGRSDLLQQNIAADSSEADVSEADVSEADVSEADVSEADVSEADVSEADVSEADVSEADVSEPDPNKIDIDSNVAGASAPSALTAVVNKQLKAIVLNWEAPSAGAAVRYVVWRITVGSSAPPTTIAVNTGTPPSTTATDSNVKNNTTYIYYVTAGIDENDTPGSIESTSGPSNLVQITY